MTLHHTIKEQIKEAMRARDTVKLNTLRSLNAMFLNEMIASKSVEEFLSDDKVIPLIKKSVKQHKDSIELFAKGKRDDLVAKEQAELKIIESFLPPQMDKESIKKIVSTRIEELKSSGQFDPKSFGKIMGIVMKDFAGKADGNDVKAAIEELLKQ
jgi:uncharacterized protein